MPIHYPDILRQSSGPIRFSYDEKDVILYALGVGFGEDGPEREELRFVYEKELKLVPTAVTVLDYPAGGARMPEDLPEGLRLSTIDRVGGLHGEQKVELHRALPTNGSFTADTRYVAAYDKGRGKGAVLMLETRWTDDAGRLLVTSTSTILARADGGFGGPRNAMPTPHDMPARNPDFMIDLPTRASQALLYRLNGDRNPLHADPDFARKAGFPRPILHGLCTYGITCRAVIKWLGYDAEAIASHQARFSSAVYPGEVLTVRLWRDGAVISFEAEAKDRGVTVIRNGRTVLR